MKFKHLQINLVKLELKNRKNRLFNAKPVPILPIQSAKFRSPFLYQ